MELAAARSLRRAVLAVAVVAATFSIGASRASALPGLGLPAQLPVLGLHVNLPCDNPLNHGLVGRVLGAAHLLASDQVRCFAQALGARGPQIMAGPTGYGPAQIQAAYKLKGLSSAGRTVAIVDAYNDPNAESDLATYRQAYGLQPCTTANGCFKKVNQQGSASPLPAGDYGWATEISLDLDAVSAACPDCHILLVEANSANTADLMAAEDTAVKSGAAAVSNSWGGNEDSTITGLTATSTTAGSRSRRARAIRGTA